MKSTFELQSVSRHGRAGRLLTAHGAIDTPFFMPIATKGAVKTLMPFELVELGASIVLSNTYHLNLRPGMEVLAGAGGLHRFMGWDRPILTDSGGYQVFSLGQLRKMSEHGVQFRSHIDGREILLTPEDSIRIQQTIGSDIMMVLDECCDPSADRAAIAASIGLTRRWAERCVQYFQQHRHDGLTLNPQLFGIVQGGVMEDLRRESAKQIMELDFDGYAIGGLAVGESEDHMMAMTAVVTAMLPTDQPRYFMGGAQPRQLVELVRRGVDMFDCVIPTRNARHGKLFVWADTQHDVVRPDFYRDVHITNQAFAKDFSAPDPTCDCLTCRTYSRAYLRHLFIVEDPLAWRLATIHNLRFYMVLLQRLRTKITSVDNVVS